MNNNDEVKAIALRSPPTERQLDRLAFEPQNWEHAIRTAEALAKSGLLPEALGNKPQAVLAIIMQGRELGLTTMQSIRGINVIKGKPSLGAQLMVALVLNSGKAQFFDMVESSDRSCTFETQRIGSLRKIPQTWTIEMAARANLMQNENWRKYPADMLRNRCCAVLARAVYPDVVFGLYDPDEVENMSEPEAPRKSRVRKSASEVIDEAREGRTIDIKADKPDAAQAPDPSGVSPPDPQPEPAPASEGPKLVVLVPPTDETPNPGQDANQVPEAAESKPADGNATNSTKLEPPKVFLKPTEFWKRLKAVGCDKAAAEETTALFGAQPGHMSPELRGVYVLLKEAGLSVDDVARDMIDNFGAEDLKSIPIESWLLYVSLLEGAVK